MYYKRAYAKINLGLKVESKREDNFHNLKTIMMMVDLYDELYFKLDSKISLDTNINICNNGNNLVYKAALLLQKKYNVTKGCKIFLHKNIPLESGLAGGSSDAAVTLEALNELWQLNLNNDELLTIGSKLGSDVPFCLLKKPAILEGRGDVLKEFIDIPEMYFVLVFPNFTCSTQEIFKNHIIAADDNRFNKLINAIKSQGLNNIGQYLFNDLETTVEKIFLKQPIIEIKKTLLNLGCNGALMSGSGSTVFGITISNENAQNIKRYMQRIYPEYQIITTKTNKF